MVTSNDESFTLEASDGTQIAVRRWLPDATPKAVAVIAHGVSEHAGRYDRFARALNGHGYAVYASDHRGHGAAARERLGDAGKNGWRGILEDLHRVLERAKSDHPGVPAFYIGHSMGSILGQSFLARYGSELAGAVLIGVVTSFAGREDLLGAATAAVTPANANAPSELFGGMFAGFNEPFAPAVTGFEWLSRDPAEVRAYVDDPLSGNPLTNATVVDFLGGWMEAGRDETHAAVPKDLPVLIVAGSADSAGENGAAPRALTDTYRAHGVTDVCLYLYQEARHEVLNETNRDDVVRDIVAWLDERVTPSPA